MGYSDDNVSTKSADIEYSTRSRRGEQNDDEQPSQLNVRRRRSNMAVPLPASAHAPKESNVDDAAEQNEEDNLQLRRRNRPRREPEPEYEYEYEETDRRRHRQVRNNNIEEKPIKSDRKRMRLDEDSEYDDYGFEDEPKRPRNRFMSWLESLRIVEEMPQQEDAGEYEEAADKVEPVRRSEPVQKAPSQRRRRYQTSETEAETAPAPDTHVPVPTGRQRRAEIAEYSEDDATESFDERPVSRCAMASRRRSKAAIDEIEKSNEDEIERSSAPQSDADAEAMEDIEKPQSESANDAACDENPQPEPVEDVNESPEAEPLSAAPEYESDEEVIVRRRPRSAARRSVSVDAQKPSQTSVQNQEAARETVEKPDEPAETLEQRYINASVAEKRDILFKHWKEQFTANLVIPAKPEKLQSISTMVKQILDACSDEYALGERWEKIDELLGMYSSAVVAEYGYKKLLTTVQAEEKQRIYARPSEDKPPRSEQPPLPKLDDAKLTDQKSEKQPDTYTEVKNDTRAYGRREYSNAYDENKPTRLSSSVQSRRRPNDDREVDFDYKPERSNGIGSLFNKIKSFGNRSEESNADDHGGINLGSRIKQLFRKGDVLDYSDYDAEGDFDSSDDGDQYINDARDVSGDKHNAGYDRNAAFMRPARKNDDFDYEQHDAAESEASDDDKSAAFSRKSTDNDYSGFARRDDAAVLSNAEKHVNYTRGSDKQAYDGYVRTESKANRTADYDYGHTENARPEYVDEGNYRNDEPGYDTANDYKDDYTDSPDPEIYDESYSDYTPERPDYSRDYEDEDSHADKYGADDFRGNNFYR